MILITLGDPKSINVEILLKALSGLDLSGKTIALIGSLKVFEHQLAKLDICCDFQLAESLKGLSPGKLNFFDIAKNLPAFNVENLSVEDCGILAYRALLKSAELSERFSDLYGDEAKLAVVTCPINKVNCIQAGMGVNGQTEFYSDAWGGQSLMVLGGDRLRVGLVTNHVPVSQIRENLSIDLYVNKAKLLHDCMREAFGIDKPRIAICGLNPHAGEGGEIGDEEKLFIEPAVAKLNELGIKVRGPESADTVFYRSLNGEFDAVLASYHDQGLPALKIVEFESAVNITYGLKHFRISPDHGPASDLYLKNMASFKSMRRSIERAMGYVYAST
jgi:4-hydroxythreonine-4-phosphate dehydrogenase